METNANPIIETVKKPFKPIIARKSKKALSAEKEVIDEIRTICEQIDVVYAQLSHCSEELLIDSCIYKIMSLNARYEYYLGEAKSMGISVESYSRRKIG